jgi:SHS2 domain-containing protein
MAEAVNALVDCFADVSSALPGRVVPFVVAAEADERQLHDVLDECLTVFEIFGIVAVGTRIDRAEDGSVAGCIDAADVSQVRLRSAPPIGVRLHELEFDESSGHAWHCLVGVDA